MSPFQIQFNDLLEFDHEPCEDDNASYVCSKLYHDQNVISDCQGSNLHHIMNRAAGNDCMPYITIMSLSAYLCIYECDNFYEQMYQNFLAHSPMSRIANDCHHHFYLKS